jgi:hypothetical protein
MDYDFPESIEVTAKTGDRLILARSSGDSVEYVTIDFEYRRWQLGNHPNRVLNFVSTPPKGRNWKKELVRDATGALLSLGQMENLGGDIMEDALATPADGRHEDIEAKATTSTEVQSLSPGCPAEPLVDGMTAYAWKRLHNGELSQDINGQTPEELFIRAGFRPHRVADPIQGFLCVHVRRIGERWIEIKGV